MQQCNEPPQNRDVRRAYRSNMPGRLMKEIDPENVPAHGVYSTSEPYDIIEEIKTILSEKKIQLEAASDAWKVNFSVIRE